MKAKVTISRCSDNKINIRIVDVNSRIEFAHIAMEPANFAECITGLSDQEGELTVKGLEFVGKTKIRESRKIVCPLNTYDTNILTQWLEDNAQEEGWMVETYLGSQSSVVRLDGKTFLNYSVIKYVDQEEV